MKAYGRVDVYIHIFLTSALAGGEWSASRPCRFTPGESSPGIHWIGGWVDPRADLDDMEKRKFLTLPGLGTPTPWSSIPYPVAIPTELSRLIMLANFTIICQRGPVSIKIKKNRQFARLTDLSDLISSLTRASHLSEEKLFRTKVVEKN
jgi:hypothetical protein